MRFRQFRGFGAPPSEEDLQAALQAINELNTSQAQLKSRFQSTVTNCSGLGSTIDSGLYNIIQGSDADIDKILAIRDSFVQGEVEIATLMDAINGHLLANDALAQALDTYGCNAIALGNGTYGQRQGSSGAASSGGGGSGSGVVVDANSTVIGPDGNPMPAMAIGSLPDWLKYLVLLGGLGLAIYYFREYKKKNATPQKKKATRRAPRRSRRGRRR